MNPFWMLGVEDDRLPFSYDVSRRRLRWVKRLRNSKAKIVAACHELIVVWAIAAWRSSWR